MSKLLVMRLKIKTKKMFKSYSLHVQCYFRTIQTTGNLISQVPSSAKPGQDIECVVQLTNPMGVTLTKCQWQVEGPGIQKPVRKTCG